MIDQWYEQWSGELTCYIKSKGFTHEDAEDVCGAVFLEAVKAQPADIAPRAWLYLVAKNRMIERWRRDGRKQFIPLEDWHDAGVEILEIVEPSIPLDCLTTEQKAVIQARFTEDRSVEETATLLGIKPGAVRGRQHRALARMRTEIEAKESAPAPPALPPMPDPLCANGDGILAFLRLNRRPLCAACALLWLSPESAKPPPQDDPCAECGALGYVVIRKVVYCAACALNLPFSVLTASVNGAPGGMKFRRWPANQPPAWAFEEA